MKKIMTVAAAVAMTAMTMVSCDGDNKADLKDGVDSLAYDLGVFQSEGINDLLYDRAALHELHVVVGERCAQVEIRQIEDGI